MIQVVRENAITVIISADRLLSPIIAGNTFNQNERHYIPYAIKFTTMFLLEYHVQKMYTK